MLVYLEIIRTGLWPFAIAERDPVVHCDSKLCSVKIGGDRHAAVSIFFGASGIVRLSIIRRTCS